MDREQEAVSPAALKSLVDAHPDVGVFMGHELDGREAAWIDPAGGRARVHNRRSDTRIGKPTPRQNAVGHRIVASKGHIT